MAGSEILAKKDMTEAKMRLPAGGVEGESRCGG